VRAHLAQQIIEVAGLGNDLEARILEQAGDSRSKQERIFSQHDAHEGEPRGYERAAQPPV
jgi:hypothetical protein